MKRSFGSEIACAPAGDTTPGGGTLAQAKETLARTARETTSKLKTAAVDTATRAKDQARHLAGEKKETAAERLGSYSSAMHESARSLEERDPNIAWFTHRAADRLQGVADYMRTRDFAGLRQDAENIARRHPAVFFGGLFALGLILGNVVKAGRRSADDRAGDWEPEQNPGRDEPGTGPLAAADIPTLPATGA